MGDVTRVGGRGRRWAIGGLCAALAVTGVHAGSVSAGAAATTALWPTYHLNAARTGNDVNEPSFASITHRWTTAALDGKLYGEPLIDAGNVIVATENNSMYAFNVTTGSLVWHKNLGVPRTSNFPCGNIM